MRIQSMFGVLAGLCLWTSATGTYADNGAELSLAAYLHNGISIAGVNSCGKIWRLKGGHARMHADGTLTAKVTGLVLNDTSTGEFNGTPDGVDAVAAAVVWTGPGGPTVVAQSDPVPLSKTGDAAIEAKLPIPGGCFGPVIMLRERYEGKIGGWLAATGF